MKLLRGRRGSIKTAVAIVSACCCAGAVQAYQFETDPDFVVNLDNSLQYTLGWRAQNIDPKIGNHLFFDQGDYKFPHKGDLVTNRFQDLVEFQTVYKQKLGFRVTGSFWKDWAYDDVARQNPAFVGIVPNAYPTGHYSPYTNRFYRQGGELLDAFVFLNTEIADKPVYVKAGRLTQYWGNAFFFGFSNIAYSQHPIDFIKGFSQPGSEVKELFLPRKQILLSADLSPELSVSGQYFFEYKPNRYPDSGTFLGFFDPLFNGPPNLGALNFYGIAPNEGIERVKNNNGNFGVKANWSPKWAGGDMGFYYRQFDEVHPWLLLVNPATGGAGDPVAKKVKLVGFSYEKGFGLISTGFELNQRRHTALYTQPLVPTTQGAKGTITNFIANTFVQLGKTPVWDSGILLAEISYTHLNKVTDDPLKIYHGVGQPTCLANDNPTGADGPGNWQDGCATNNSLAFATLFIPQWQQVFAGVDIETPISYTMGVHGNPAYQAGSFYFEGTALTSIGIKATYQAKSSVLLQYNHYRWRPKNTTDPLGMGLPSFAGFGGAGAVSLNDRAWWQLQFKTSF